MDFLVGDATGLLRRVDAATRCTYTYKMLPQDTSEAICCACWSGGPGLSAATTSETELTLGRRSGRVEALVPALPLRVRAAASAASSSTSFSSTSIPNLLIRSSYTAATPVVRCFQMPAPCVQLGLLHEPQDRLLLNSTVRDDLVHHDPFFSAFNSICPLSPSPLLPSLDVSLAARGRAAAAAESPDGGTPHANAPTDAAKADAAGAAETTAETVDAREASSIVDHPRLLFCIDEVGHLVLLDWQDSFSEQLRSDHRSSSNNNSNSVSGGGSGRCTRIFMRSVPSYKDKDTKATVRNNLSNGGNTSSSGSSCKVKCNNIDSTGTTSNHVSDNTLRSNETSAQPASETDGMPTGEPWYCWSHHTSEEEEEVASHVRAAWRVCGQVSCATPVNPLLPDRFAFGGRNNDVKVFDFSQEKYVWAAKNVKNTLLRLQVPVHVSSLCWLPQLHPLILAAGTAAGALRLYDLRCQRRPVFEQEYACSSSSLGGAAARERRVLCALCTETCDEEAAALLVSIRKLHDIGSCTSNNRNSNATWTSSDVEKSGSSSYVSNSSSSSSAKAEKYINCNLGQSHNGTICSKGEKRRTGVSQATESTTATEGEVERLKIHEAVRSLYGKEKTRVFFSDNHGAVYVHRVLTGKSLLRRIDSQQKKHNRTSCYASSSSSSSETESEDEEEDDDGCEEHSDEKDGDEEEETGFDEAKENDEEKSESSRTAARAGGADATGGPEYDKKYAMKLLRQHRLKRVQKLSTIKNSGRLSQSSAHGAQFITLFEGCYKGAMGAIVALNVDRSKGLLVGAGYGRHTLVWNVRSRKLLFKVYLKQQLRTIVLRCSDARSHGWKTPKLPQCQAMQQEKHKQTANYEGEEISNIQQRKTPQQPEISGSRVKQKQKLQRQQLPQHLNVALRSHNAVSHQKDYLDTSHYTGEPEQRETRILQAEVRQCPTGLERHQDRRNHLERREQQSVVEETQDGVQRMRARKTVAARKGSATLQGTQLTSVSSGMKKKRRTR